MYRHFSTNAEPTIILMLKWFCSFSFSKQLECKATIVQFTFSGRFREIAIENRPFSIGILVTVYLSCKISYSIKTLPFIYFKTQRYSRLYAPEESPQLKKLTVKNQTGTTILISQNISRCPQIVII